MSSIPSSKTSVPVSKTVRVARSVDLKSYYQQRIADFKKLNPAQQRIAIQEATPWHLEENCEMGPALLGK